MQSAIGNRQSPIPLRSLAVAVLIAVAGSGAAKAQSGGDYVITKSTIDSGGATVTGGDYRLSGTVGQPDAANLSGGDYTLIGGFWSPAAAAPDALTPVPGGVHLNRFVGVVVPASSAGQQTALRITLTTINHRRLCCSGQDGNGFGTGCNVNAPCNLDSNCSGGTPLCRQQLASGPPDFSSLEGKIRYVNSFPGGSLICPDDGPPFNTSYRCATLGCEPEYRDWATDLAVAVNPAAPDGLLYITGDAVIPSSAIHLQHIAASCGATPGANACSAASASLTVGTANWGDMSSPAFGPPDGRGDVLDIPAITNKLKGVPTIVPEYRAWLKQRDPEANTTAITVVDLSDVQDAVLAKPYPASRTVDACTHD
jgi:hypothetical protein